MSKYKVKQKVWKITISKYKEDHSKYSVFQDGIQVQELQIIGISPYKIVLNNDFFTVLDNDDREGYRKDKKYCNGNFATFWKKSCRRRIS